MHLATQSALVGSHVMLSSPYSHLTDGKTEIQTSFMIFPQVTPTSEQWVESGFSCGLSWNLVPTHLELGLDPSSGPCRLCDLVRVASPL